MEMESFGSREVEQVPQELLNYEKWWTKTYGREPSPEENKELVEIAKTLAKSNSEFKGILAESLANEFIDNEDGLENAGKRKWALVTALSTYGKEFGLKVD